MRARNLALVAVTALWGSRAGAAAPTASGVTLPDFCPAEPACEGVGAFLERHRGGDALVVFKKRRLLFFYRRGRLVERRIDLKDYDPNVTTPLPIDIRFPVPVALGLGAEEGPPRARGQGRSPEGEYTICSRSAASQFTRFLSISYPGPRDVEAAVREKRFGPSDLARVRQSQRPGACPDFFTKLGGLFGIHGPPTALAAEAARRETDDPDVRFTTDQDWTLGCVAVENRHLRFLWREVKVGTPILLVP